MNCFPTVFLSLITSGGSVCHTQKEAGLKTTIFFFSQNTGPTRLVKEVQRYKILYLLWASGSSQNHLGLRVENSEKDVGRNLQGSPLPLGRS